MNPDWWDKPQHNLTRIEFKPIKSDATRVAALLSGELDLIAPAPLQDLRRIGSASGFKVIEEPSLRLIMLSLNFRPELKAMPGQKNPLLDLKVRQAMWHAIDLETIKKRVMRDKSRNTGTLVAPPVPGYAKDNDEPLAYDTDKAKKLLAEAGYPERLQGEAQLPQRPLHQRRADLRRDRGHVDARRHPDGAADGIPRHLFPAAGSRRVRRLDGRLGDACRRWTGSAFCRRCSPRRRTATAAPIPAPTPTRRSRS